MSKQSYDAPHEDGPDEYTPVKVQHPTITREHITGISTRLKDWYARSLDVKKLSPEQSAELLRDLGFGLNDCLAYIEQQEQPDDEPAKDTF